MTQLERNYLIIGGSTKCGTTSLYNYFREHPEICASVHKETRYFWGNEYELPERKLRMDSSDSYDKLYSGCQPDQYLLEATPDYLYSKMSADEIRSTLKGKVYIIFILRDPIQRLQSWYRHSILHGLVSSDSTFEDYLEMQVKEPVDGTPQFLRAMEQGLYSRYLEHWYEVFGKGSVMVFYFEDLLTDPGQLCKKICKQIGIGTDHFENYLFKPHNVSYGVKSHHANKLFRGLQRRSRPILSKMTPTVRKSFRWVGRNVESLYTVLNQSKELLTTDDITDERRSSLIQFYGPERLRLKELAGVTPPWPEYGFHEN
jgi:hypothetical protein